MSPGRPKLVQPFLFCWVVRSSPLFYYYEQGYNECFFWYEAFSLPVLGLFPWDSYKSDISVSIILALLVHFAKLLSKRIVSIYTPTRVGESTPLGYF